MKNIKMDATLSSDSNEEFKNNKDIVMHSTNIDSDAFQYASTSLKSDRQLILQLLDTGNTDFMEHIDANLYADIEIMSKAIKQDGLWLKYASNEIKNNVNICKMAVANNSQSYNYCGELAKQDEELILSAVSENGFLYQHVNEKFYGNKKFVKTVLTARLTSASILVLMNEELKDDKEFILELIASPTVFDVLWGASDRLRNDKDVILAALKKNGSHIYYASDALKNNMELALLAVKHEKGLKNLTEEMRNNKHVVLASLKNNFDSFQYIGKELMKEINYSDPIKYLESAIEQEELQSILPITTSSNKKRNKI